MCIGGCTKAIEFGIVKTQTQVAKAFFFYIDHENGFAFSPPGFDIDKGSSEKQQTLENHAAAVDIPFAQVVSHFEG